MISEYRKYEITEALALVQDFFDEGIFSRKLPLNDIAYIVQCLSGAIQVAGYCIYELSIDRNMTPEEVIRRMAEQLLKDNDETD